MIEVRRYGTAGPTVIVVHGGPGAPGSMAPVARALSDELVVLEPLQRPSGGEPLTVARHIADLDEVVRSLGGAARARRFVVGRDAGARLRGRACRRGCGGGGDRDRHVRSGGARAHERAPRRAAWNDMLRLQAEGVYPQSFARIRVPVLMLHGAYDPHPGEMIRDSLAPYIAGLAYRQWERCGHDPWRERHARDDFYATLRAWLRLSLPSPGR